MQSQWHCALFVLCVEPSDEHSLHQHVDLVYDICLLSDYDGH